MNAIDPSSQLQTITDWQRAYADGASPTELLSALHRRLALSSPDEIWITRTDVAGLASRIEAIETRRRAIADSARFRCEMPLFGVPFAVKDNIDVLGLPTTVACRGYDRPVAAHATVVARLLDAGAVCMGKTNLDQFATGLVGARSPYGRPSSAIDPRRISGGSSSGSAVAVARADVAFALGTDTAGSGRVPAAFNNIVGLKPTPGRVSTAGVVPACRSIDCVSIFASTVADAAHVLAVVEGADPRDACSAFRVGPGAFASSLRIGVPRTPRFAAGPLGASFAVAFDAAIARLTALGHRAVTVDFEPLHAVGDALYGGAWVAERHAVVEALLAAQPDAVEPSVREVVERARRFSATEAFRAVYAVQDARRDTAAIWAEVDLLMVPTAPDHPRHTEVDADPIGVNTRLGAYTNFVNFLGWCALALPAGFAAPALPFGVTFIAPGAADAALARFGATWEAAVALPLGATSRLARDVPVAVDAPMPAAEALFPLAVVGAHLSGQPLNGQLRERGATLRETTTTAPRYRLYALPGTVPPKPGMVRVADGDGRPIEVEVWDLPERAVGGVLALVPWPLAVGAVELADGRWVHGFVCDAGAAASGRDISAFGGWRAFLADAAARRPEAGASST